MTEQQLLEASTAELAGISFDCTCGRHHAVDISLIRVSSGIEREAAAYAALHSAGKPVLLVADNHTFAAAGETMEKALAKAGLSVATHVFEPPHTLVPDEKAVGELLLALPRDAGFIVGVGSGTLNDLCRIISDRTHVPYLIVCTAPSVDGYASTVSPLIIKGRKTTLEAVYPSAILADPEVLRAAPATLLHAGFGDLLGKVTALTDWALARRINDEYHCPVIEKMVRKALSTCTAQAAGVADREAGAVTALFEALALSGVCMGMIGNSRPASGAEHHLSHYWEMDALKNGQEHALHGNAVGSATVAIARTYELLREQLPAGFDVPSAAEIRMLLSKAGAAVTPADLGIPRDLFHRSMREAMFVRDRYTILRFAADHGKLEEIADLLTDEFYGAEA